MRHKTTPKFRYPWRAGNRIQLLVDGARFVPAMVSAIEGAERHVLLEIYLFESGRLADRFCRALVEAAERGVTVCCLLDDFGARGLSTADRHRLTGAGVRLTFYNPLRYGELRRNLMRDHRKLLVVDGETAFTGGAGITDDFYSTDPTHTTWHEVMVAIRGPCVADWHALFARTWERAAGQPLALTAPPPASNTGSGVPGRVTSNTPQRMEIKRSLLKRIRGAERRVWIATAYFIPSWKIRRALRRAAQEGIDVRLLLPGRHTDHPAVRHAGRRFYGRLLSGGVRIFEYRPRFLHAKVALCDDWCSTGSSNIDRWNLRWNLEANQEIDTPVFADQVARLFTDDFLEADEITYEQWRNRPWHRRLLEQFWGRVDLLLERLGERRS